MHQRLCLGDAEQLWIFQCTPSIGVEENDVLSSFDTSSNLAVWGIGICIHILYVLLLKYEVYTLMGLCAFVKVLDVDHPGGVCL